jgi:CheY-like chemotaxis protein
MLTRGISVGVETRLEDNLQVQVDPAPFREVLTNLILNACDALSDDGQLIFITRKQGHSIVIDLSDNGRGMSEETLDQCRETFFSTKGDHRTGLGLSLSETIIRGFGGELKIHSTPQLGTTVTIRLPRPRAQKEIAVDGETIVSSPSELTATTPGKQPQRPLNILVVDDEPIIARLIAQLLSVDGHHAEFVTSASEALDSLARNNFDAVLSDRSMPQMNGDELAVEVASQFPGKTFVMVTGYGDLMTDNDECPAGVDLILSKPVNRDALRSATDAIAARTPTLAA